MNIHFQVTSRYDADTGVSFAELNKQLPGDRQRDDAQKIFNRPSPSVKRIYLKRGDIPESKPKFFIWKLWQSPGLAKLIKDAGAFLAMPPDVPLQLYDSRGIEITDCEQIFDGMIYIVDTSDASQLSVNILRVSHTDRTEQLNGRIATDMGQEQRTGWRRSPIAAPPKSRIAPSRSQSTVLTAKSAPECFGQRWKTGIGDSIGRQTGMSAPPKFLSSLRGESVWDPAPRPHESIYHNYGYEDKYGDFDSDQQTNQVQSPEANSRANKTEAITSNRHSLCASKSEPIITKSIHTRLPTPLEPQMQLKSKTRRRSRSMVIYKQKDQIHPDAYIIYVFLNGHGMDSKYFHFQRAQLKRGIAFILELIARKFGIRPGRLCNMDGKKVNDVSELMSRGAYVMVPAGQSFWEAWYFLPDNAIDTSLSSAKIEERNIERERLIQLREKHRKAIETNSKIQQSNRTQITINHQKRRLA